MECFPSTWAARFAWFSLLSLSWRNYAQPCWCTLHSLSIWLYFIPYWIVTAREASCSRMVATYDVTDRRPAGLFPRRRKETGTVSGSKLKSLWIVFALILFWWQGHKIHWKQEDIFNRVIEEADNYASEPRFLIKLFKDYGYWSGVITLLKKLKSRCV